MVADSSYLDILDHEDLLYELSIIGEDGERRTLDRPWEEQAAYIDWFFRSLRGEAPRNGYVLKSRQMGLSTIVVASLFIKAYLAPSTKPRSMLTIGHEEGACKRMIRMVRNFATELPPELRPTFDPDNKFSIGFEHNGSVWASLMAGGRGQGRSETYTDLHATEMAFWPTSSSATAGADTAADEDAWASVDAVIHDPEAHRIIESTANGPRGFFYKMSKTAKKEKDWEYFFFPWTMQRRYRRKVSDPQALIAALTDEERGWLTHGVMDLEQIAWRRHKLHVKMLSPTRFRREYPLTEIDPFLLSKGGWFDADKLNRMLQFAPRDFLWPYRDEWTDHWTVWHKREPGRRYAIGVDTSGGTGNDDAVIYVLRDDYVPVAMWRSNKHSPKAQARAISRIGGMYGKPWCLIECNKFGLEVFNEVARLGGVRLMKFNGKPFYSTGKNSGDNKRKVYTWARYTIDHDIAVVCRPETVTQLQSIVERESGMVAPPTDSEPDDEADAWVFAVFACRKVAREASLTTPEEQREQAVRLFQKRIGATHA